MAPAWAVCSSGGISGFPVLAGIEALTISVDHDPNGVGDRAAAECAKAWRAAGRDVRMIRSPIAGEDAADLIRRAQ
jgi:putative DNA primase/helicase